MVLLVSFVRANAQEFSFGFQTGIGTYTMDGLKSINGEIPQQLPFETKLIADFPPYFYYQPSVIIRFKDFGLGLVYSFQSTGSRISARDFSGEYRFDMKVRSNAPGIYSELKLSAKDSFNFNLYLIIGTSFSNLETKEYFKVADTLLTNSGYKFKSQNYYVEPGIKFQIPVGAFGFAVNLGYLIQFGKQPFHTISNKQDILYNPESHSVIKPEWNGMRLGISVLYNLK